eukprot:CAMPEP_0174319004 /NCGR_PEP_ID=MMETSP0810-20121108/8578_1 /TAXON_ID=73025 ORGANISM="Eutreptiella gymnastica-like, Strain CCMP1594" /NCGR_SAMPLE_ID=MMETSP0810 /ASSEMBLY_ACC=CAM_ASM_000659 /LENGTH=55 /DNA_ID=CAMNT_0015429407 /DNA_START=152 /DNA_END=319 /DNA_ORIENTATION=-
MSVAPTAPCIPDAHGPLPSMGKPATADIRSKAVYYLTQHSGTPCTADRKDFCILT